MENEVVSGLQQPRRHRKLIVCVFAGFLLLWLVLAYVLAPYVWKELAAHDPALDDNPRLTQTSDHHPGDRLNVALTGTKLQLQSIMRAAGWHPASALGLKSDFAIAVDSVLSRSDDSAPVSNLYLFGRKEDLAFEQPVDHVADFISNQTSTNVSAGGIHTCVVGRHVPDALSYDTVVRSVNAALGV